MSKFGNPGKITSKLNTIFAGGIVQTDIFNTDVYLNKENLEEENAINLKYLKKENLIV